MGIKSYKPTSPARRYYYGRRLQGDHHGQGARAQPARAPDQDRRPQQQRSHHQPLPWRWTQAALPHHRLAARQDRRPRHGRRRSSTIRTAPRASRSSTTRTARSATSSRPTASTVGDTIISSRNADIKPGNSMPLRHIPLGTMIHNIEMKKGKGAQLVRSAGVGAVAHGEGRRLRAGPHALAARSA